MFSTFQSEMLDIVSAIYMMGKFAEPFFDEHTAREHVEEIFQVGKQKLNTVCRENIPGRQTEKEHRM